MDKATIITLLDGNDKAVERALVVIYNRQTADEQQSATTSHLNGMGFNGLDAEFGTSLATKVLKGWTLSPKQLAAGRRMVKKYWKQLLEEAEAKATEQAKP